MKPNRSQANICLTLILWRALPFSCMSLRDLQTEQVPGVESIEKMTPRIVESKSKLTTAISPTPTSCIFVGKKRCLILLHPSFSHGIINEFEECQPCLNLKPMQGIQASSYTPRYSELQHCLVNVSLPTHTPYCVWNMQFQNSAQVILVLPSSTSVVQKHSGWGFWPKLFSFCIFSASKIQSAAVTSNQS